MAIRTYTQKRIAELTKLSPSQIRTAIKNLGLERGKGVEYTQKEYNAIKKQVGEKKLQKAYEEYLKDTGINKTQLKKLKGYSTKELNTALDTLGYNKKKGEVFKDKEIRAIDILVNSTKKQDNENTKIKIKTDDVTFGGLGGKQKEDKKEIETKRVLIHYDNIFKHFGYTGLNDFLNQSSDANRQRNPYTKANYKHNEHDLAFDSFNRSVGFDTLVNLDTLLRFLNSKGYKNTAKELLNGVSNGSIKSYVAN